MERSNEITLPAQTEWLQDPAVLSIASVLGNSCYFVGGCVRDALLEKTGADVDIATPLKPEEVTTLANAAGYKAVPTGIDHGTVTVVVDGRGFEVTTFRLDVETDGRRAIVHFSDDIKEDARRRDFTLNALYARVDGRVIDPLGTGIEDCLNRRIRFIEDADMRIREDYLRLLRFFRFHAYYAAQEEGFDSDVLDAIARNVDGLQTLPAERIGAEVKRLFAAPDPSMAVAAMRQTGCLLRILPGSDDCYLAALVHHANALGLAPDPMLRLAVLGGGETQQRLRLSREDSRRLAELTEAGYGPQSLPEVSYRKGADIAKGAAAIRAAIAERSIDPAELIAIDAAATARFPVSARDLMPAFEGKALGEELARLENKWIASGFTLEREDLMKKQ